ncbi:MAG: Rieske 2Fe-2S domain-containing protein [Planctomycetota bacterium]
MQEFKTVGKVEDIPPSQGQAFQVDDRTVAVFNVDGEFLAIDDMCPHMGASLAAGHFDGEHVYCPWHAWGFDVRDGTWCDNPRVKIDTFQVRVVEGAIQVSTTKCDKELDSDDGNDGQ